MKKQAFFQRSFTVLLMTAGAAMLVAGCGKKDPSATQVVASVDGEEISVHQMNSVLSKARGITPENLPKAKIEVLNGLVEQQLEINLAMSKKLDRSPEVVTALENAKREILARAALEQIAADQPKPTDDEVQKYYQDHPALFSERRIFNLEEIALPKSTPDADAIRARVASAKSMEEVVAWLKGRNLNATVNSGTRAAEQLPLEILPKIHNFKDGQLGFLESQESYMVVHVLSSRQQPVSAAQAQPLIKVFLTNQRAADAIKLAKTDMKAKAKISYFGEFAGGEASFKAKAEAEAKAAADARAQQDANDKAAADAAAKQRAQDQAAAQAEQEARSKARADGRAQSGDAVVPDTHVDAANLEKGIKGLK